MKNDSTAVSTYFDAMTLLERGGDLVGAARHLRDALRLRRPARALLRVPASLPAEHPAHTLAELARALGVAVAELDEARDLQVCRRLIEGSGRCHLVHNNPAVQALITQRGAIWHGPEGIVTREQVEQRCEAAGLTLTQWPALAVLSSNPWINLHQAGAWLKEFGDFDAVIHAAETLAERTGAPGRRLAMAAASLSQRYHQVCADADTRLSDAQLCWQRPRGAHQRERIRSLYARLGVEHWLDEGAGPAPGGGPIRDPDGLNTLLEQLDTGQVGFSMRFFPGKKPRQVTLHHGERYWEILFDQAALADVMEARLAQWLKEPAQRKRIVTEDVMAMALWLDRHDVGTQWCTMDLALLRRYCDAQELNDIALSAHAGSLMGNIKHLSETLQAFDANALDWIRQVEIPLSDVLYRMHASGVRVDEPALAALDEQAQDFAREGDSQARNLKTCFLNPLRNHVERGAAHPFYDQFSGRNSRVSTSRPQLQNIPGASEWGQSLRRCLKPLAGDHQMVSLDYQQIELVILAHLSGDEKLLQALRSGVDLHRFTAAELFELAPEQVSDAQRRAAKAINFGLIYGKSAFGLARDLQVPVQQANRYMDAYFERMAGARAYLDRVREGAVREGSVQTFHGRRIHIPGVGSEESKTRARALRQAVNAPMQGSAAEIVKKAMLGADRWLCDNAIEGELIMQVHDELVFSIAEPALAQALPALERVMRQAAPFDTGVAVQCKVGPDYASLREYPVTPARAVTAATGMTPA